MIILAEFGDKIILAKSPEDRLELRIDSRSEENVWTVFMTRAQMDQLITELIVMQNEITHE